MSDAIASVHWPFYILLYEVLFMYMLDICVTNMLSQSCGASLYFLNFFQWIDVFSFHEVQCIFSLLCLVLLCPLKKKTCLLKLERYFHFSSTMFVVLAFIVQCAIWLKLLFMSGTRWGFRFFIFSSKYPGIPALFLKAVFLSHWTHVVLLLKASWLHMCGSNAEFWSTDPFIYNGSQSNITFYYYLFFNFSLCQMQ